MVNETRWANEQTFILICAEEFMKTCTKLWGTVDSSQSNVVFGQIKRVSFFLLENFAMKIRPRTTKPQCECNGTIGMA